MTSAVRQPESRVFLVQEPLRRNPTDRSKVELKYSLEPLKQYGNMHVLLSWEDSRSPVRGHLIMAKLRRELTGFTGDDYLACAGNPALIAAAAMMAAEFSDVVRMLVWDNHRLKYDEIVFDVNSQPTR